jgi:type IV pilus assembly protein PilC
LPIFGSIINKACIARFSRTLSTTFASGMKIVDALQAVATSTGNLMYEYAVLQIREDIINGVNMQQAVKNTNLFPTMVEQMIAIGEESGQLDHMLAKVAAIYEEEVDLAVDGLSDLLEPILIVIMGVLVGGMVTAMYMPIFQLGQVI